MAATRRTVLAGLAPVALIAGCQALPAEVSAHTKPHPDAALLSLADEFEEASRESDAAWANWKAAFASTEEAMPARPDALRRGDDFRFFYGIASNPASPEYYTATEVSECFRDYAAPGGTICSDWRQRQEQRARDIVEAHDEWSADCANHRERTGFVAADRRCSTAYERRDDIAERVRETCATTVEGVLAKARVALATGWDGFETEVLIELVSLNGGAA